METKKKKQSELEIWNHAWGSPVMAFDILTCEEIRNTGNPEEFYWLDPGSDPNKATALLHNTHRPVSISSRGQATYAIFDVILTQTEWFRILGYTEEEQLVHCLKWGRYD